MHWTQTPEGREKLRKMQADPKIKAKRKKTRRLHREGKLAPQQATKLERYNSYRKKGKWSIEKAAQGSEEDFRQVAYAFGRTAGWLNAYAESLGISASSLTYRVGEALQRSSRRSLLGA